MDTGDRAFLEELFAPVGGVTIRAMFGGLGIFREGTMFALVADEILYLRADEASAPAFEAEGCAQWTYDGKDRAVTMPYWRVPERLLDDREDFRDWALTAFGIAARAKAAPKKKARRKKS